MINLRASMNVNTTRNLLGPLKNGSMPPALEGQRQMTTQSLTDLALHQKPPAPEMGFQKPPGLWLSNPLSAL